MKYNIDINGYNVEADFSQDSIDNIFIPLLRKLTVLRNSETQGGELVCRY